jgi:hypothetical protein
MSRPYTPIGIGWLLAVIVAIVAVLALLNIVTASMTVVLACILGLALALLL